MTGAKSAGTGKTPRSPKKRRIKAPTSTTSLAERERFLAEIRFARICGSNLSFCDLNSSKIAKSAFETLSSITSVSPFGTALAPQTFEAPQAPREKPSRASPGRGDQEVYPHESHHLADDRW